MKVSVPTSYSRPESAPIKVSAICNEEPRQLPSSPGLQSEQSLPLLPAQWWQAFLYGSADGLLAKEDALRAVRLVANRRGKETEQLEIGTSIRSGELRKLFYAKFGSDLALHTMQALWLEAASNGEPSSSPAVQATPETVVKFFEREDPVPPWRWESNDARAERERLTALGGWCG